ncbi:hypothetical protein [Ramlibacter albus]|uniref:Uncharacterized protein n=1 Tax=Ramlibacter albus TaxID=2079448 RepID=A0A923M647_9BURK|nr:hypothetical protein [Ramlibacter albus]MBC5764506.1 hypothetical protein [Ramlibacter albus]
MLHPLLSLWRSTCRATFYDRGVDGRTLAAEQWSDMLPPLGTRRTFRHTDEAVGYLRYWAGDMSASNELGWLLKRCSPTSSVLAAPEHWVHALGGLLVSGAVAVVEESVRSARPARIVPAPAGAAAAAAAAAAATAAGASPAAAAAAAAAAASPLAALPALASVPAVPRAEDLLPALEDARIEGAEVLPELDQSLAQVNATMGQVDTAAASVAPAPDKVPGIGTAMSDAAAAAQKAIDEA